MHLKRLYFAGFGRFNRGIEVVFRPAQVNLIVGNNETGKSTLISGLLGLIFGFRDKDLERRFEPWNKYQYFSGEIEFELEDRTVTLRRDFATNNAEIIEEKNGQAKITFSGSANPRGRIEDCQLYYEKIQDFFGFQSEEVFKRTIFVEQLDLETEISDELRQLISGTGDRDYLEARERLVQRFRELTWENPWGRSRMRNKRLIEHLEEELAEKRGLLGRARQQIQELTAAEVEVAALEEAVARLERELQERRRALTSLEKFQELLARKSEQERRLAEVLREKGRISELEQRTGQIVERIARDFTRLEAAGPDYSEKLHELKRHEQQARRVEKLIAQEQEKLALRRKAERKGLARGTIIAAVLLFLAGVFALFLKQVGTMMSAGLVASTAALLVSRWLALRGQPTRREIEGRLALFAGQLNMLESDTGKLRRQLSMDGAEEEIEKALFDLRSWQELREEREKCMAVLQSMRPKPAVEEECDKLAGALAATEHQIKELEQSAPYLVNYRDHSLRIEALRTEAVALETFVAKRRQELQEAKTKLAVISARSNFNLDLLEEELSEMEQRIERLHLERDALRAAIDGLDEAVAIFQALHLERLEARAGELFQTLTAGRYIGIKLDQSLQPRPVPAELPAFDEVESVALEALSCGARDQLYFAVRLALAEELSRRRSLPLLLDDPFVNFDEERLETVCLLLKQIAERNQVIILTHDRRHTRWFEPVLDLNRF